MTTLPSTVVDSPADDQPVWGHHLLLDLAGCRLATVRSAPELRAFVTELVDAIDMVAFGEPLLAHFADHVPAAAGWSLVQLIETSSITGHFCDASGDAYLDVFSCKAFAPETAIEVVERRLQPRRGAARFVPRAAWTISGSGWGAPPPRGPRGFPPGGAPPPGP